MTCAGSTDTCTSCKNDKVLNLDSTCQESCGATDQTPINGICKECDIPCASCRRLTDYCTSCMYDYYLYNGTCVEFCPDKFEPNLLNQCVLVGLVCPFGFTVNEAGDGCVPNEYECKEGYVINQARTACVPEPGSVVPFPFLLLALGIGLLVLGSYLKDKDFTRVLTCLIALIGSLEIFVYFLMVVYAGVLENWAGFALSLIALIMLMVANVTFYVLYRKEIQNDKAFQNWCKHFPKVDKYVPLAALVVNFKLIKMIYSGFYGLESCLAHIEEPIDHFFQQIRMVTYFSFIFVYCPIVIADFILFATVDWGYQLLVLAIESFIFALFIFFATIVEFKDHDKWFTSGDEQFLRIKPRRLQGVMSGIEMDESSMIRGKGQDDDYEVQLRKKALLSILS